MTARETTVLIVEPDLDIQRIYRQRLIHDPAIRVIGICSTLASATTLLAHTECDILFTELVLPDGEGLDLIRKALSEPHTPSVAVISGLSSADMVTAAIDAGAIGYLIKGESDLKEIASFVRMIIQGGSPLSPMAARFVVTAATRPREPAPVQVRRPAAGEGKNPLSPREAEVLNLLVRGLSFADISEVLNISPHTVTAHMKKIYRKLQVHSRGEAVFEAAQLGILADNLAPQT